MGTSESTFALEMEERGVVPLEPFPGKNKKWLCKCLSCGNQVEPRYATVVQGKKGGCNFCAKKNAAQHRKVAAEAKVREIAARANLLPLSPYIDSHTPWTVKCLTCGLTYQVKPYSIANGRKCAVCANADRISSAREVRKLEADEIFRSANIIPVGPFQGINKPYPGLCQKCGNTISPTPQRVKSGGGCRFCSIERGAKKRRDAKYSDSEARAIMLEAANEVAADSPYLGTTRPWPGVCLRCGLPTRASLGNVLNGHGACKVCAMSEADSSFDYFGPAILYFLKHDQLAHFKVGIMGSETSRLKQHVNEGWKVLVTWDFEYGYEANYVEQYCLQTIREMGVPNAVKAKDMPQGGHMETFSIEGISEEAVLELVVSEIDAQRWPIPLKFISGDAKQKPRRTCTVIENGVQCTNKYSSNGCCRAHFWRLQQYGDPTISKRILYTNPTCEVVENNLICGLPVSKKGMCSVHYHRDYEHGDATLMKRSAPKARSGTCSVEGCIFEDYSLGLCKTHYHAERRRVKRAAEGKDEPTKYTSNMCSVPACTDTRSSLGYCTKHYRNFKLYGNPIQSIRGPIQQKLGHCRVEDCNEPDDQKGLCRRHYSREYKRRLRGKPSLLGDV